MVYRLTADETGTVRGPILITAGLLLSIATRPGTPAPAAPFDVELVTNAGVDLLYGCGKRRHPTDLQRTIVRRPQARSSKRARNRHPILEPEVPVQLRGALGPRASVVVVLFVAPDDGRVD